MAATPTNVERRTPNALLAGLGEPALPAEEAALPARGVPKAEGRLPKAV